MEFLLSDLLLGSLILLLVLLLNPLQISVISHGLDHTEVVLQRPGQQILINVLSHLILKFQILHVLVPLIILLLFLIAVDLYLKEEVEERFLLDLLGLFFFLLVLLLDDLDGDVLALLPVDLIA